MTGPRLGARLWWGAVCLVVLLWGTGALVVSTIPGLPSTPLPTLVALPLLAFARDVAVAITVGALAVRLLTAVAPVRAWALGWGAISVGLSALSLVAFRADVTATELLGSPDGVSVFDVIERAVAARALAVQVVFLALAVLVAAVGGTRAWRITALLLAVIGAVAPAFAGHAGLSGPHSAASVAIALHVAAVCAWVGGLAVVSALLLRQSDLLPTLLPRFSVLALVSVIIVAESGLVTASLLAGSLGDLLGTAYGSIVLAKAVLLAWLIRLGWLQRRRAVDRISTGAPDDRPAIVRTVAALAGVEMLFMGAAMAAGVVLSRIGSSPIPGEGFAPLSLVVLGLGAPAVVVGWRQRGWKVSDSLPEAAAFVLLLVMVEVGGVGLLNQLLGPAGLLIETTVLVLAGWAAVSAARRSRSGLIVLMVGVPLALIMTTILSDRSGSAPMAVVAVVVAEVVLGLMWWSLDRSTQARELVDVAG